MAGGWGGPLGFLSIHNRTQLPEWCPDYWTINQDEDGRAYLPGC